MPTHVEFDSALPGGFGPGQITLPRPDWLSAMDAQLFSAVRIYEAESNRTFYEGRVVGTPQVGANAVELSLEGWAKHLEDDETARFLGYDRDMSRWTGPSSKRQITLYGFNLVPTDPSVIWDLTSAVPAIETGFDGAWASPKLPISEAWYDAGPGLRIGAIDYAWKLGGSATGASSFEWYVLGSSDDNATATDTTANLEAAGPGSGTLTVSSRRFVFFQFLYAVTGSGTDGFHYSILWTLPGVVGDHGLPLQGTVAAPNTGRGLLVSDMAAHIVGRFAPLLRYSTGTGGSIEPTSFAVPHAVFLEDTKAADILQALVLLGGNTFYPLDWGVYDNREFFLKSPGTYGTVWRARRDQATEATDQGPDAAEKLNGVKVTYDDGTGSKHSVGPVGSGSDTETAILQDTNPTNVANNDGARHWKVFDAGITSTAGALLIGQVVLANANRNDWRGDIVLKDEVRDSAGNLHPVEAVRAGDRIVVEDDSDVRERRVVGTSYSDRERSVSCSVGAPGNQLDALLARLGVSLEGRL